MYLEVGVSNVIGRVTRDTDRPRGPDARLEVRVPEAWLRDGATLELDLPRNLACAVCEGGGCDACERSGAVTLRGRGEPAEVVEVTLPKPGSGEGAHDTILLRIPDHGGLPAAGDELPRGNLLLRVKAGDRVDAGIARVRRSVLPPASKPPPNVPLMIHGEEPRGEAEPWKLVVLGVVALVVMYALWQVLRDLL